MERSLQSADSALTLSVSRSLYSLALSSAPPAGTDHECGNVPGSTGGKNVWDLSGRERYRARAAAEKSTMLTWGASKYVNRVGPPNQMDKTNTWNRSCPKHRAAPEPDSATDCLASLNLTDCLNTETARAHEASVA
jgi:hypothetical protein